MWWTRLWSRLRSTGGDPNWGRIVTAIGNARVPYDAAAVTLSIAGGPPRGEPLANPVTVFAHDAPAELTDAQRATLHEAMRQREVHFHIRLGPGHATVEWLGCDLSYDYVRINAEYTT